MCVLDLNCSQSFSFTLPCSFTCKNSGRVLLGCGYQVFLYFDIPPCLDLYSVKQARLVLFKIPDSGTSCYPEKPPVRCFACPLLEFYSPYGCAYSPPVIDEGHRVNFYDNPNLCSTEVDVTETVNAWARGSIENKGIILTAMEDSRLIIYASGQYEIAGMSPMLRLVYENTTICQPLSVENCDVALRF
ncbi:conserved hypothetical protein [uncultured Eubacteriales bacterium]|uniref:Uncharacterized protein n=1 Tax=uncultured Eubacteriales bacterium TaxID=172733 RepID=A0A212JQI3_9FIRM|nr:conserved hypothetical protein [uncultured Eubacteriales bacterium]